MLRFLILGAGGGSSYTYAPGSDEAALDLIITSSFDVATVGHLFISSEFTLAPTGEDLPMTSQFTTNLTGQDLPITSQFTTDPTGEDLPITASFTTAVV